MEEKHFFKMEMTRIWSQKSTYLVLIILTLWVMLNIFFVINTTYGIKFTILFDRPAFSVMSLRTSQGQFATFTFFLFPFIIHLVGGNSFIENRESGRLLILLNKCGKKLYLIQAAAIMLSTFIISVIPYLIEQIVLMLAYPLKTFMISEIINSDYNVTRFDKFTYFPSIYENNPYLFNLICILLYGIYAVSIALLCYSVSLVLTKKLKKNIAVILIPLGVIIMNLVVSYISPKFPILLFSYIGGGRATRPPWITCVIYILLIFIISFIIIIGKSKRRRDEF